MTWLAALTTLVIGCTGVTSSEPQRNALRRAEPRSKPSAPTRSHAEASDVELKRALAAVASGRYPAAETTLLRLSNHGSKPDPRAQVALSEIELMTGRTERALARSRPYCRADDTSAEGACAVAVEALRRNGNFDEAVRLLEPYQDGAGPRHLRLALAEVLADRGRTTQARMLYRRLVEDFTEARVQINDARQLAVTGRAAHRLGALKDADEFFNRAEMAGMADLTTLLWRGELYLAAHDPKRARDLADEAFRFAPDHPLALLFYARVRLVAAQDAEQAERHVRRALEINPECGDARAILAGLALRDLDFERARHHITLGLEREPRHLELLSLRAVAGFLADDQKGFDAGIYQVLQQNPSYATVYRLVAEYAEAEHRYEDAIPLLRRAMELDPDDSIVRAQLGVQLTRFGEETEGRKQLALAFRADPFDLRVRNTLVLYERKIDKEYSSTRHGQFSIRLPNAYREVLLAIVPSWLDHARSELQKHYGKLQPQPLSIEMYADQDSFGVRTSGVPATFLQGVCFGRTIVARLPTDEPTNLGMTLWHELSHVHHLQLSKHRVPRWFTEGLAEVETAYERNEWSRGHELAVYEALRAGRLPHVGQMNRAFSHAGSLSDLGVAYVASTYLVDYLVRTYGYERIRKMLEAWGNRHSTDEVVSQVLSTNLEELDVAYRAMLGQRFAHFDKQYMPPNGFVSGDEARSKLAKNPRDEAARAIAARAELAQGRLPAASKLIREVDPGQGKNADLLWVTSMVELADQKAEPAEQALRQMVADGRDGYFVRLQLALVAHMRSDISKERSELTLAHEFHSTASEPLYRLAAIAKESGDTKEELHAIAALAKLEESDLATHLRLVELYLELGHPGEAKKAAESLSYVNPLDAQAHWLIARAALANDDRAQLIKELRNVRYLLPMGGERDEISRSIARAAAGRKIELQKPTGKNLKAAK